MKTILAIILSLQAAQVASAADVCTTLLDCGTYEQSSNDDGVLVTTKIVIASVNASEATLDFSRVEEGEKSEWNLVLKFQQDGSFVGTSGDRLAATGICGRGLCTFSLVPMANRTESYGISGVVRFLGNALEYNRFSAGASGQFQSSIVLQKK